MMYNLNNSTNGYRSTTPLTPRKSLDCILFSRVQHTLAELLANFTPWCKRVILAILCYVNIIAQSLDKFFAITLQPRISQATQTNHTRTWTKNNSIYVIFARKTERNLPITQPILSIFTKGTQTCVMTQVSPKQKSPDHQMATDHTTFMQNIAAEIVRRGFQVPALLMLEGGPLLTFLGSQLLWVAQPALSLFMPAHQIQQTASLLESPEAVDALTYYLHTAKDAEEG
jgi:hypothetical protein